MLLHLNYLCVRVCVCRVCNVYVEYDQIGGVSLFVYQVYMCANAQCIRDNAGHRMNANSLNFVLRVPFRCVFNGPRMSPKRLNDRFWPRQSVQFILIHRMIHIKSCACVCVCVGDLCKQYPTPEKIVRHKSARKLILIVQTNGPYILFACADAIVYMCESKNRLLKIECNIFRTGTERRNGKPNICYIVCMTFRSSVQFIQTGSNNKIEMNDFVAKCFRFNL